MKSVLYVFALGGIFCGGMVAAQDLMNNSYDSPKDAFVEAVLDYPEAPAPDFMTPDDSMNRGLAILVPDFDSLPAESLALIEETKKGCFLDIARESCLLQDQFERGEIELEVYSQDIKELRKRFFAALYVLLSVVLVECDKSIEVAQ